MDQKIIIYNIETNNVKQMLLLIRHQVTKVCLIIDR